MRTELEIKNGITSVKLIPETNLEQAITENMDAKKKNVTNSV